MLTDNNHVNDFHECLKQSHAAEELPFWEDVYKKAFPTMVSMINHRQDGYWQRAGIDRSVVLQSSKQILIDEKVRGRNKRTGRVYDDVALEFISNDKAKSPGWVCKPLMCDFIAYAIAPLGKCYLLPVTQLQNAWANNGQVWRKRYNEMPALNNGYTTWFCPVPVNVLFKEIGSELRVMFEPFEYDDNDL